MEISSSAFKDGEKIPIRYVMPGAGGKNISAPVSWKKMFLLVRNSFALSVVDPHPVAQNWVHWLVINIPADASLSKRGHHGRRCHRGLLNCGTHLEISAMEVLNLHRVRVTILMYLPSMH
jgi:phosphatidylethanolamine-binding protein (PEBP) family uncharacterized protein